MAEKIAGFKKFSDFKKILVEEVSLSEITPDTDSDRPMTPNLPNDSDKIEKNSFKKRYHARGTKVV
jgi:hypothetical protein